MRLASILFTCMLASCVADAPTSPEPPGTPTDPTDPTDPDDPPDETRPTRTVLLIPGTTITGDWFDTMAERLRRDGFEPVVYEPPDLLTGPLADGAVGIGQAIRDRIAATGESRIDVVAECNGGVATRYYLQVLGGSAHVDQVVTFVSAHHGTWEAPFGSLVVPSLADITPGSPFLQTLDRAPFPAGLKLTSIYSCWDEFMIPYTTSRVDGATNVEFCGHFLTHFDGFYDEVVYERILATLRGNGDTAPTSY